MHRRLFHKKGQEERRAAHREELPIITSIVVPAQKNLSICRI